MGYKRRQSFCVACGQPTPAFELFEGVFDEVSVLVQRGIQRARCFTMNARWNLDMHALTLGLLDNRVAVVSFVCNQMRGVEPVDQLVSFCTIRSGT